MSFLGMQVLLTGSGNFKDIQNSRQNCFKNKLVRENAVTRAHGICMLWSILEKIFVELCRTLTMKTIRGCSKNFEKSMIPRLMLRLF